MRRGALIGLACALALGLPAAVRPQAAQPQTAQSPTGRPPAASAPAASAPAASAPVAQRPDFAGWIRAAGLGPGQVGAIALPLDGGAPLLAHNDAAPLNPASTMKLLTSYAALSLLGPEYRWRTAAFLRGRLEGDVLHGDLVLRGGGDPKLVIEDLAAFVARMRQAGLRELRGDLVVDDALYDVGDDSVEAFDGEPSQPYNVRPHALLMNFKSTRIVVQPGPAGAAIALDPALADVEVDNDVRLARGPCRHGPWGLTVRDADGRPVPTIRVSGQYSLGCGEQGVFASVLSHRQFIHALFKAAWLQAGGSWNGRTRLERGAGQGQPWLEWASPRTLADVVADVNKFSNNVMARQLLLHLASERARPPATPEGARRVLGDWLAAQSIALPGLVVDNGSGLSRNERISAAGLARLLRHAAASPYGDLVRESLPVAGVDGTMKHRLVGEPIAGRAWIKTGSLVQVRSIAGYVDAASGRRYAVVLLVNGPGADASQPLQDRFLRWVHANG